MIHSMKLETMRLMIRPYQAKDLQESFELMHNEEVLQYMHMDVMSLDEYSGVFEWLIQSYNKGLEEDFKYSFGVFLKDTNTFIGWIGVGCLDFQRQDKEIYYLIGRDYWGKGYASEAIEQLIHYCFNDMKLESIVAKVHPGNGASKRIIEKLGLRFEYVLEDLQEDFSECNGELLYSISADEYKRLLMIKSFI
ncbi:GNAT family N-acetyltransferase [Paenibacillus antarcticus]|uniref:Acetyltransferase n=1 Tax=Paenibacillus antarcticus TaxID=253703 RepID=A0A162PY91_9BACL|nr:GNAT family N-acetyltransferase [Paenibacillus antarcticus]OAB40400.1 acetyltransferase [Paenibacillus antarcticus]